MEIRKVSAVKINPDIKEVMMKLPKERLVLDCIHLSNACDGYMNVINVLCDGALFARFTKKQRLAYRLYRANRAGKNP